MCDHVDIIWQAIRARGEGSHFSEMLILAFCFVFYMINLAYPLWVLHTVWKFPGDLQDSMRKALFGFTNTMKAQLISDMKLAKSRLNRRSLKRGIMHMAGFIKAKKKPESTESVGR